jgi:replicative DNA helicase
VEALVEDLGNKPPDPNDFWYGPMPSINRMYGSLHRPGNVTIVGARTGVGKSAFSMFYNLWLAEKKNVPLLWLDFGEMTIKEIQMRAVTLLTNGQVPVWALESGTWRQNAEWTKLVRESWERVKKMKFYFQDVSNFSPQETISFVRRFSYNKVGRANPFLVVYDYFKPFDTHNYNNPEWKQMGHFLQDIKSFIVNELPISWWGAIQLNRSGITTNKSSDQIDDSENAIGLSDRITQQSSHAFILRFKTMDEIAVEENRFGNMKLINVKHRHLGKDFMDALRPVKVGKKRYIRNYINIEGGSFYYEDRGDMNLAAKVMKEQYDLLEEAKENETL